MTFLLLARRLQAVGIAQDGVAVAAVAGVVHQRQEAAAGQHLRQEVADVQVPRLLPLRASCGMFLWSSSTFLFPFLFLNCRLGLQQNSDVGHHQQVAGAGHHQQEEAAGHHQQEEAAVQQQQEAAEVEVSRVPLPRFVARLVNMISLPVSWYLSANGT